MVLLDTGQSSSSLSQRKQYSEHEQQGWARFSSYLFFLAGLLSMLVFFPTSLSIFCGHCLWVSFLSSFTFCDSGSVPLIYQGVTHNRLTVLRVETLSMCQSVSCWLFFPFGLMGTLLALGLLVLGSALVPNSVRKCLFLCLFFHMNQPPTKV